MSVNSTIGTSSMKLNFYVTHYSPLTDRKTKLKEAFSQIQLNPIWIEGEPNPIGNIHNITQAQYSSTHKHIIALEHFVDSGLDVAIVFEDDVMIESNFLDYLRRVLTELDGREFDMISLGNVSILESNPKYSIINPTPDQILYLGNWKTTACAHCIMYSRKFAMECVEKFDYQAPFDIFLDQYVLPHKEYVVGRTYPYIKQATIDGDMITAIPTEHNGYGSWYGLDGCKK